MNITNDQFIFTLDVQNEEYSLLGKTWRLSTKLTPEENEDSPYTKSLFELIDPMTYEEMHWQSLEDCTYCLRIEVDNSCAKYTIESITKYLTALEKWMKGYPDITTDKEPLIYNKSGNPNYYDPVTRFGTCESPEKIRSLLVERRTRKNKNTF